MSEPDPLACCEHCIHAGDYEHDMPCMVGCWDDTGQHTRDPEGDEAAHA